MFLINVANKNWVRKRKKRKAAPTGRLASLILTYNRVVTLHGQSVILHSARADHVELPVTRCGGEISHVFQSGARQGPGVVVWVVVLNLNAVRRCT